VVVLIRLRGCLCTWGWAARKASELIYNFVCFLQAILVVITAHVMVHIMTPLAVLEKDLHLLTLKFHIMSSLVMEP
jgi:hypothetical protein